MPSYSIEVNGKPQTVQVDADTPLLWVLRDTLDLVGTKFGCGIGQCGACTVHMDGNAIRSCSFPVSAVGDKKITTIEGIDEGHPLKEAWRAMDVPQCGYCQAGQIMTAAAMLESNPNPTEEQIEATMSGNICRCGTYLKIKAAIKAS